MPDKLLIQDNGIPKSILSRITATAGDVMTGKTFLTRQGLISNGSLTRLSGGGTCLSTAVGSAPTSSDFQLGRSFDSNYMSSFNQFAKACNIHFFARFGHGVYRNTVKVQVGSQVLFNREIVARFYEVDVDLSVNAGDKISIVRNGGAAQTPSMYFWVVTLQ